MGISKNPAGKTIVVTGSTSGIGLAAAVELTKRGAFVIGVGRSQERCRQAEKMIKKACPEAEITFLISDLSSMKQVKELAESIRHMAGASGRGFIDVLVNNAGTVSNWYTGTPDGFELQFAVNHLAPFLLTHELLPLLKKAPGGRIITVSSGSHYRTRIHWKDVLMRKHYNCLMAYKQSKLANVVFSTELNRRLGPNASVHAYAADPGLVNTDIGLKGTTGITRWVWKKRGKKGVNPSIPAASIAYLALEPSIQHSQDVYWKDCKPQKPSSYSQREDVGMRLWELSERMCGIKAVQHGTEG